MTYRTHKKAFKHSLTARNLGYRTATVAPAEEAMAAMLSGKTVIVDGSTKSTLRCPPGYELKCKAVGNGQYECKCRQTAGHEDLKHPIPDEVDPIVESRAGSGAPNLRGAPRLSVKANVRHRQGIRSGAKVAKKSRKRRGRKRRGLRLFR